MYLLIKEIDLMEMFDINDSILGRTIPVPNSYDSALLFRIPRFENRERYQIKDDFLLFCGFDVWNCYEISFLTDNGLPVSRVMKMIYPANSKYLVESKSLKLYLNSFNMQSFGSDIQLALSNVNEIIRNDLSHLLETKVDIHFFDQHSAEKLAFKSFQNADLLDIIPGDRLNSIHFERFNESPFILKSQPCEAGNTQTYMFKTDVLRSNCRVTNQPDWGDLFVYIETLQLISLESVLEYLVSFRQENHFHEEVVEMIYKRFYDAFSPSKMMVGAMYMRRGGIDINPIRASHNELIDEVLVSTEVRASKTLRQ